MMENISGQLISELNKTELDGSEIIPLEKLAKNYGVTISEIKNFIIQALPVNKTVIAFKESISRPNLPMGAVWNLQDDIIEFQTDGWSLNLNQSNLIANTDGSDIVTFTSDDYATVAGYVPRYCAFGWTGQAEEGMSVTAIKKNYESGLDRGLDHTYFFQFGNQLTIGPNALGKYVMNFQLVNVCTCNSNDKLKTIILALFDQNICVAKYDLTPNKCLFGSENTLTVNISQEQYQQIQKQPHDSFSVQFEATLDGSIEGKVYTETNQIKGAFVSFTSSKGLDKLPVWMSVGYFNIHNPLLPLWTLPLEIKKS